jgi:hypothetical protein
MNNLGDWLGQKIAPYINDAMGRDYNVLGSYYAGNQRKQLKTKMGAQDENIIQNYVGLAVDRSVSRLFRGGVEFILPEASTKQQEYLDRVWDLNKEEILLYQLCLNGAVYGTPYVKICPDEMVDPYTNYVYPKLVALDPTMVRFKTEPDDQSDVEEYDIEYNYVTNMGNGNVTVSVKEVTSHPKPDTENESETTPDKWMVDKYEQVGSAPWVLKEHTEWPFDFPPILHWKNLPSLFGAYGDSDIDDSINIQDKSNFVVSNTAKIIKFHAHPETIGTGFSVKQMEGLPTDIGSFRAIPNENAKVFNLEMASDLASSREFAADLRQSIFDISREIDLSKMGAEARALTNFGLQVLYTDAINKNDTKRQLYGDALKELNRRLLVIAGFTGEATDPGEIQWGPAMPVNDVEEIQVDQTALGLGIVDKQTVAERWMSRYGVDWETIQQRMADQKTADNQGNANIGAQILKQFNQGNGVVPNQMNNAQGDMKGNQMQGMMNGNPAANSKPTA